MSDTTADRIAGAALTLFNRQGVRRTTLEAVAFEAGVTRITVYRYFGDKRGLVAAVCQRMAAIFVRASEGDPVDGIPQIDARLNRLGMELAELPRENLLGFLNEIRRTYPEVYEEFRATRQTAEDTIFHQAVAAAARDGSLREGLNPEVLKVVLWAAVAGLIENPRLVSANVPLTEIFSTVTAVFRHGILAASPPSSPSE